jgi:hypothetical protein
MVALVELLLTVISAAQGRDEGPCRHSAAPSYGSHVLTTILADRELQKQADVQQVINDKNVLGSTGATRVFMFTLLTLLPFSSTCRRPELPR